jgi:kynurenine formamidase
MISIDKYPGVTASSSSYPIMSCPMPNIIDLSHPLTSSMSVYPGDPEYTCRRVASISPDGFTMHAISMGTHSGTHIDAPSHFIADGKTIDEIPLESLIGLAVVVDLRTKGLKEREKIVWNDVAPFISEIAHAPTSPIELGNAKILLLCTGWSQHWGAAKYFQHPFLDKDCAKRIIEAGFTIIGMDLLSPDDTEAPDNDFGAHMEILGQGGIIAENMTNLEVLVDLQRASKIAVSLVPLNLHGCDGSPVRALAWKYNA